jgi:hemerythrin
MLAWSEQYATGVPLVDAQHQMLIRQINELERMLLNPPLVRQDCDQLLRFLSGYLETHFRFEEECMHRHRCPAQQQNKQGHAEFLAIFMQFQELYHETGPEAELLKNFQLDAANWISEHILTLDLRLRGCVRQ